MIEEKKKMVVNPQGELEAIEEPELTLYQQYLQKRKHYTAVERKKIRTIIKLINGEINGTKAAQTLKITTRQVRNLKRQVLEEGLDGVVHKNKQHKPYNTYNPELSTMICKLYRKEYRGTNFSEFARIVQDNYGVTASRSTIYNFLRRGRIRSPQRKVHKKKVVVTEATQENTTATVKKGK